MSPLDEELLRKREIKALERIASNLNDISWVLFIGFLVFMLRGCA